jgi:DNA-binding transcriptional LysR family regulator
MNTRPSLTELTAFAAVVRHNSFRAAADELGLSASTLSHMIRALEERLGVRLLNRTTRSVAATEAGAQLFRSVGPILGELDVALADVGNFRERPSGRVRLNALETAAHLLMREIVPTFGKRYPEIELDIVTEGRFVDIVAEGFDAGVRLAESVPHDMVAIPFGGDLQFVAVAAPAYLERHGTPRDLGDLNRHRCIRFRMPSGKIYRWEFEHRGQSIKLDVPGTITLDHMGLMVKAAIAGLGIAFVTVHLAREAIDAGQLKPVLEEWSPPFAGYHLYYPSHRLVPRALRAFIDVVKEVERHGPVKQ